ncbi:MAG: response regulator transcription factor [Chloroflexota bacterium]
MPDATILIVEDDPAVASALRRRLGFEGFDVHVASDGADALDLAAEHEPDLIVLDLMLPGMDGLEVARRLRLGIDTPILMLTARGAIEDKVAGFESGADDYLVKPFAFPELLLRIRALLRRARPPSTETLRFKDIELSRAAREARRAGTRLDLTAREFDLLEYFLRHPNQVLTRQMIFQSLWGSDFLGGSKVIDVNVSNLRDKLESDEKTRVIQTVRGVGYALRAE